jgi:hypothetical protein
MYWLQQPQTVRPSDGDGGTLEDVSGDHHTLVKRVAEFDVMTIHREASLGDSSTTKFEYRLERLKQNYHKPFNIKEARKISTPKMAK